MALPLIGGEDLLTQDFLKAGGEAVLGSLLYATFAADDPALLVAEFVAAYSQQAGRVPDRFAALAYDAFGLLGQAIRRAGSRQSSKIRDALVAMPESPGVTGPTRWTPEGTPLKQPFLYRVEAGEGGGGEFTLLRSGG
jgi:branched-chain amino acid transport system substrate-binding protein